MNTASKKSNNCRHCQYRKNMFDSIFGGKSYSR